MHDVAEAFDAHEFANGDAARRADPAQIVAPEIDEHRMFGALFRVASQCCGSPAIVGRIAAPRASSRKRPHRGAALLEFG
jgi:hypothetical protein